MRGPRGEMGTPSRGRGKRVISLAGRGGQNSATGKETTCSKEARNYTKGKGQMGTKEQRAAHTKSRHYITGEWRIDPEVKLCATESLVLVTGELEESINVPSMYDTRADPFLAIPPSYIFIHNE